MTPHILLQMQLVTQIRTDPQYHLGYVGHARPELVYYGVDTQRKCWQT